MTQDFKKKESMSDSAGILQLLHELESESNLFEPEIEGFSLWPVVRFPVWLQLANLKTSATTKTLRNKISHYIFDFSYLFFVPVSVLQQRLGLRRKTDILFLSDEAYRSVHCEHGWWDIYLDDIANHPRLKESVFRCERRHFWFPRLRVCAERHLFLDSLRFRHKFLTHFQETQQVRATSDALLESLRESCQVIGQSLDPELQSKFRMLFRKQAICFEQSLRWYGKLMDLRKPQVAGVVNAYGNHGLVAAAKQRHIPTIEFQHGVIHHEHPGYIWPNSVLSHRDRMPIPDRIATYGEHWTEILLNSGFWKQGEVISVGSTRMDWMRRRYAGKTKANDSIRIVYTTQAAARDWAVPIVSDFLRLANQSNLNFKFTVKVHRREANAMDIYHQLAQQSPHVQVQSPYEGDTLELIAEADFHISAWSTCHYESIGLGTPTIVIDPLALPLVDNLRNYSLVLYTASAEEILNTVISNPTTLSDDQLQVQTESERLFRRNAVENAVELLSEHVNV